jgi:acetolactate synthase-1/2/3 large subunit
VRAPWSGPGAQKWRTVTRDWKNRFSSRNEKHNYGPTGAPANLYEFVDILSEEMSGKESILTDAGQPHPILAQAFRLKAGQRYLNPGSFAEMGYALPAAFGAAVAAPGKTIVSVFGDGSLQTNIQELQTLVQHKFNVKVFVINNDGYASIRNTQKTFFDGFYVGSTPDSGVTLPDTEKICHAYGLSYVKCENRDALRDVIRQVLARPGPVLCEVMAQVDQRILPAVASRLLPDGTMRSNALHQMAPEIGIEFIELIKELN